jgi:dienelactone hydrolase
VRKSGAARSWLRLVAAAVVFGHASASASSESQTVTTETQAQVLPLADGRQTVFLPVRLDGEPVRLEATIERPAGRSPFPLLVFNHGSTGRGNDPAAYRRTIYLSEIAAFFVARGYVVAAPMRRGRGQSDGRYAEGLGPYGYVCEHGPMADGIERALADIHAAVELLAAQPYVDRSRILIGGQSRGGILALAYAGRHPEIARGVVNFVGGWTNEQCSERTNINADVFARAGARFRRPTVWIYGIDDRLYGIDHSRANFAAFQRAGGIGEFAALTPTRAGEGHLVFRQTMDWQPIVARYLHAIEMP